MTKIYDENGNKLTTAQVCNRLATIIPQTHKDILAEPMNAIYENNDGENNEEFALKTFSHIILDMYKYLPTDTPEETESKKLCLYLMKRYMKATIMKTDLNGYSTVCSAIMTS